jgi:hypothetical protein
LSATIDPVVMDPYASKAARLMRFNATVFLNGLPAKANTLIDTSASLNLMSKDFLWLMVSMKIVRLLLS